MNRAQTAIGSERWREIAPHLDRALELTETDRLAFLASLREQDPRLADDLENLLEEHRALGEEGFLEQGLPPGVANLGGVKAQEIVSPAGPVDNAPGPLTGRTLGEFELRKLVGAGGFGDVYLAEQVTLRREAVVKVLRSPTMSPERTKRFLREAHLASRLDHPYAAHVYAFGSEPDGVCWIAMERVRGSTLHALLEAQGPMPIERLVPLLERICEVVHSAHEQGIAHRDLKPENVMVISRAGRLLPKLLDFGIARALDTAAETEPPETIALNNAAGVSTTRHGAVFGSPPYMAPELWVSAHDAGPPADQYALAALAYEALTGQLAFKGSSMAEIKRAHQQGALAPLGGNFDGELDNVLVRALAREPAQRYENVLVFAQAFREASGIGAASLEIPQFDDDLNQRFLTSAPQPIADAVAAYQAVRNAHQAREALRGVVRITGWYVGILAAACRSRTGSAGMGDSEGALALLRELRRQGLTPAGWIALAGHLTQPFASTPDIFPIPELVLLLRPGANRGTDWVAACVDGSLSESLPDSSEEAATQAIKRELPAVTALLRSLTFLLEYSLVVPGDVRTESWMGRSGPRPTIAPRGCLPPGRVAVIDHEGLPLLALWPLAQIASPMPGHAEQIFLLAGPGRDGARLVSAPQGFEHHDPELWDWFRDHLLARDDDADQAWLDPSPYRGLSPYTAADARWFFGRERETAMVANRVRAERFVAIVGPSGVGKSSFVHAGVAPALEGWRVLTLRPGRSPLSQLGLALGQAGFDVADLPTWTSESGISERLRGWASGQGGGVLIVIDQFEEIFTLGCPVEERERFVRLLLATARAATDPVRVVITLRDDFLIRAQQLPGLADAFARGLQLLGPLGSSELERILVEPARRAGYEFEDRLAARMVAAAAGAQAAVALLSFAVTRLWELRDRHFHQLSSKAYDAIGGVGGALARHADETVEAMPASARALVRTAFRHLVTFEGTRAVLGRAELEHLLGAGPEAQRLIDGLLEARLLTSSEGERGDTLVEIVHEALIEAWPRLVAWRREVLEGTRLHEQLRSAARQWEERGRPRGLLWRGDALAEYELWRKRHAGNLTPLENTFATASVADASRGRKIRRGVAASALAIATVFVIMQWRAKLREERSRHETFTLLRDATFEQGRLLMLQGDKQRALPHLKKAHEMGVVGPAIRLMIEEASRTMRPRKLVLAGHSGRVRQATYSPDGKHIATASTDGTVRIWNAETGATEDLIRHKTFVVAVAFSPNGKLVASGGGDRLVRVWDLERQQETAALEFPGIVYRLAFDWRGGLLLASGDATARAWRLPATDASVTVLSGHYGRVLAAFCGRADCMVTADVRGLAVVWNASTLKPIARYRQESEISAVGVDPGGQVVAVGSHTGGLTLLRQGGTVIEQLATAHATRIEDIAFSPDGALVATAGNDVAKLWEAATGKPRAVLAGHRGGVTAARFSPKGDVVTTSGLDGTVRLWTTAGTLIGELSGHTNAVFAPSFRGDGATLVTPSWDHLAFVWDVAAAQHFQPLETGFAFANGSPSVAISPDGTRVAVIIPDGTVVVSTPGSTATGCRLRAKNPTRQVIWIGGGTRVVALGRGESKVASSVFQPSDRSVARIWNAGSCQLEHVIDEHVEAGIQIFGFGALGELVTGDWKEESVRVWSVRGEPVAIYRDAPGDIHRVGFGPDGTVYATTFPGFNSASLVIRSPGGKKRIYEAGQSSLTRVLFDRKRHRVLASSLDQHVWVWDDRTGALVGKPEGGAPLLDLAQSPDGAIIVGIGGLSPTVWDAESLSKLGVLEGHAGLATTGGFIGDRMFMTASEDGTARVWDLETRRPVLSFPGADMLAFGPDRTSVALTGLGSTRIWRPHFPVPRMTELYDK